MSHLSPDELIDAVEDALAPERQAHLRECEDCRRQLAEVSAALGDAKEVSVPEPSPLFWQHFSERVRLAIDQEPAASRDWPAWMRWQVLLPLGATAMIILGIMMTVPIETNPPAEEVIWSDRAPDLVGESWGAVEDVVGQMDIETASAAGVIEPGVAELALLELSAEEQQELTRLLQAELMRAKS